MGMKLGIFLVALLFCLPALAGERIPYDRFLAEVREQNLELKGHAAELAAARAEADGIRLPPPMLGIGQMRDASGRATDFEASQAIPFPTKITTDHSARKFEASAHEEMEMAAHSDVLARARLLYFGLWQAQERLTLLREKQGVIQSHARLSAAGAQSDSLLRIHVLKAESDLDLLTNDVFAAEQALREKQIEMADFLNRDPSSFLPVAEELPMQNPPAAQEMARPPQVEEKRLMLESLEARESEAKSAWLPDFEVRYREMGGTAMNVRYSEIMVGASLPFLFFWEPRAASAKASAERMQGELQWEQERRKIDARKALLLAKADSLKKQLDQLYEKLLPRAEKRMKLVHNLAPRDMESLQDHRETMEAFPDLKLKALELRGEYEETLAQLYRYHRGAM